MEFLLTIALIAVVVYLIRLRNRSEDLTLRLSHLEDEVRRLYEQRERPEQGAPIQPVPIQPEARPDTRLPPPLPPPVPPRIPISAPPLSPSELAAADPLLSQP